MNLEDLRNLKEKLESEQKYVAIKNSTYDEILNATEARPLSEYIAQENTDEFVKQCEALIENSVRTLATKGIPFDRVVLSSEIGFLCKESFIEKIKPLFESRMDSDTYLKIDKLLCAHASSVYVPLSFHINIIGTGIATGAVDMTIDDYETEYGIDYGDIDTPEVTGIVNLEAFLSKMHNLGYNIELLNFGECQSVSDYMQAVIENGDDTHISVVANLRKQNDLQESTGLGAR